MKPTLLFLTCANQKEARIIGKALLDKKLAACVKQLPVSSAYWWKGKIENAEEVLLLVETAESKFQAIEQAVKKLHSYQQPVMMEIPITKSSAGVVKWMQESLEDES